MKAIAAYLLVPLSLVFFANAAPHDSIPKPSTPQCTKYNSPVADVRNINDELNKRGDDTPCCTNGFKGCTNIASSGNIAVDLCTGATTRQCIGCARLGNYVAGLIGACQKDGKVGGKQEIVETPGLKVEI